MATLLITGATGMVGRELLVRATADRRFDRVLCLVRPPEARFDAMLASCGLARSDRIAPVRGDITDAGLGLSDTPDLRGVSHVLHAAATVAFDESLDDARRINVGGVMNVLQFGRTRPRLERIDLLSTCYVAGKRAGVVREHDLLHETGFHNTYEQTKYEAEVAIDSARADVPLAVHRPSIVVGDSRTGRTGAWKVLYWPLKVLARGWLPAVPYDPDARLDIVPVDFVADAVLALMRDTATVGRTFHLAAGPGRDTTMGELAERLLVRLGRRAPWRISPGWWRWVVRPALMALPAPKLRRTLRTGLVYRPYLSLRVQFDTSDADACLLPHGVRCPRVLDYIDTIVDAAIATDFGRRVAAT